MADGVGSLEKAFASISEHWQPHRLTSPNDHHVTMVQPTTGAAGGALTAELRELPL
jgi:hypothetical protein